MTAEVRGSTPPRAFLGERLGLSRRALNGLACRPSLHPAVVPRLGPADAWPFAKNTEGCSWESTRPPKPLHRVQSLSLCSAGVARTQKGISTSDDAGAKPAAGSLLQAGDGKQETGNREAGVSEVNASFSSLSSVLCLLSLSPFFSRDASTSRSIHCLSSNDPARNRLSRPSRVTTPTGNER